MEKKYLISIEYSNKIKKMNNIKVKITKLKKLESELIGLKERYDIKSIKATCTLYSKKRKIYKAKVFLSSNYSTSDFELFLINLDFSYSTFDTFEKASLDFLSKVKVLIKTNEEQTISINYKK